MKKTPPVPSAVIHRPTGRLGLVVAIRCVGKVVMAKSKGDLVEWRTADVFPAKAHPSDRHPDS